ncbi:MAG: hypothetical protein CMF96_04375 [Candidatus Marinimicrobia bacterium]|nr:hypothetical protein [Candidatus Neomarinimicrobiota bacterium]
MDFPILLNYLIVAVPIFFLYTELHFRFPFIYSRYYINEPEILADIPYRVNPNCNVPVMVLIKDADKFPIFVKNINIDIYQNSQIISTNLYIINKRIDDYWWYKTFQVNPKKNKGHTTFEVRITYEVNKKTKTIKNHNIKTLKPSPFNVFLSNFELPGSHLTQYGDIHYHSYLTDDMVEFGAPLRPTLEVCKVLGLDFICNTDHSYDLDDKHGSWTETDPELIKWKTSRKEINDLNNEFKYSPFMIPSEELSMHNASGKNIHALILNNSKFLPGQGDGAERPFDFSCDYNSNNLYSNLEKDAICIASHPFTPVPFVEKFFFKRGIWEEFDILKQNMIGLQILNGDLDESFYRGVKEWINFLLKGNKKFIYAGNDAHGNFNKFRQIRFPMISIKEADKQILGVCRTGVFPEKLNHIQSTIDAMRSGNCFITNGPFLKLSIQSNKIEFNMGSDVCVSKGVIKLSGISNLEFGKITSFRLIKGVIGEKKESLIKSSSVKDDSFIIEFDLDVKVEKKSYFRAEINSENYRGQCTAMSNPIWLNPEP